MIFFFNEIHMFSVYFNIHFREACSFLASKRYSFGIGGIGSVNARPYSPIDYSLFIVTRQFLLYIIPEFSKFCSKYTQKEYIDGLSYQYSLLVEEYNRFSLLTMRNCFFLTSNLIFIYLSNEAFRYNTLSQECTFAGTSLF